MKYYIIWVEGLFYKTGEKIGWIDAVNGVTYTNQMTKALRVRECDIPAMRKLMASVGIADWVVNSNTNTFIKTSYVPQNTLWLPR